MCSNQSHDIPRREDLNMDEPRRIIRSKTVRDRCGIGSRTTLHRLLTDAKSDFPRPIVLDQHGHVGWYEDEVEDWINSRPRRTYGTDIGEEAAADVAA